jgi:hypothetical protein
MDCTIGDGFETIEDWTGVTMAHRVGALFQRAHLWVGWFPDLPNATSEADR